MAMHVIAWGLVVIGFVCLSVPFVMLRRARTAAQLADAALSMVWISCTVFGVALIVVPFLLNWVG